MRVRMRIRWEMGATACAAEIVWRAFEPLRSAVQQQFMRMDGRAANMSCLTIPQRQLWFPPPTSLFKESLSLELHLSAIESGVATFRTARASHKDAIRP